jgi:hypothetical protein
MNSQSYLNVTLHATELLYLLEYHTDSFTIHMPIPHPCLVATSYMSTFPHSHQLSLALYLRLFAFLVVTGVDGGRCSM